MEEEAPEKPKKKKKQKRHTKNAALLDIADELVANEFQPDIEALPAFNQPSGRLAHIALIIKMVGAGYPMARACRRVNPTGEISITSVYNHINALKKSGKVREDTSPSAKLKQNIIEDMALDGAIMASEKILEMLDRDQMRPAEAVKAYATLRDTVATRFGWSDSSGSGDERTKNALASALDALREGSEVSIKKTPPEKGATLIEAEVVEREEE